MSHSLHPPSNASFEDDLSLHLASLLAGTGVSPDDTGGTITFAGCDPLFPSAVRLGSAFALSAMAAAVGAAELRPGIIVVSVRCYGWGGPWAERGGFDMLGTAASGLAMLEGTNGIPSLPPTALINDYVTGYLGAAGATAALIRRAKEGGSYHVTVSLTRNAMWYQSLGLVPPEERAFAENPFHHLDDLNPKEALGLVENLKQRLLEPEVLIRETPLGQVRRLAPAVTYSATPASWDDPILIPMGASSPIWLCSPDR
jgi:hypothetical protein